MESNAIIKIVFGRLVRQEELVEWKIDAVKIGEMKIHFFHHFILATKDAHSAHIHTHRIASRTLVGDP